MSYILDALKKSERQRGGLNMPAEAPSLSFQTESPVSRLYIVLGTLLVVLIVGWVVAPFKPSSPAFSRQAEITTQPASPQQDIATAVAPEQSTSGADVSPLSSVSDAVPSISQPEHAEPENRNSGKVPVVRNKQEHGNHTQVEQIREQEGGSVEKQTSVRHDDEPVPVFQPIAPASPVSRGAGGFPDLSNDSAEVAPANAGIRSLSELPLSVQQSLPPVNIEGHIYDENPAMRMIIVNGKIRHEKQAVANSLKLEEITPDGVILSYQGHVFHMGVFDR